MEDITEEEYSEHLENLKIEWMKKGSREVLDATRKWRMEWIVQFQPTQGCSNSGLFWLCEMLALGLAAGQL